MLHAIFLFLAQQNHAKKVCAAWQNYSVKAYIIKLSVMPASGLLYAILIFHTCRLSANDLIWLAYTAIS